MKSKFFTTGQAAKKIGVSRETLYAWIRSGLVETPIPIRLGGASLRLWTVPDIEAAAKFKGRLKIGRPSRKKKRKDGGGR